MNLYLPLNLIISEIIFRVHNCQGEWKYFCIQTWVFTWWGEGCRFGQCRGAWGETSEGEVHVCVDLSSIGPGRRPKGVQSQNQQPALKNCRSHCCLSSRGCAQTESGGLKQLDTVGIRVLCCILSAAREGRGEILTWGRILPADNRDNLVQVENTTMLFMWPLLLGYSLERGGLEKLK